MLANANSIHGKSVYEKTDPVRARTQSEEDNLLGADPTFMAFDFFAFIVL